MFIDTALPFSRYSPCIWLAGINPASQIKGDGRLDKSFILYQIKKSLAYASMYTKRREKRKKKNDIENLGRVLDKEAGIFKSRKGGVFLYNQQTGSSYETIAGVLGQFLKIHPPRRGFLNFWDVNISHELLEKEGFAEIFGQTGGNGSDSLIALALFRTLCRYAGSRAFDRWNGTYDRLLFPEARAESQLVDWSIFSLLGVLRQDRLLEVPRKENRGKALARLG
jgi:hypothetical protein